MVKDHQVILTGFPGFIAGNVISQNILTSSNRNVIATKNSIDLFKRRNAGRRREACMLGFSNKVILRKKEDLEFAEKWVAVVTYKGSVNRGVGAMYYKHHRRDDTLPTMRMKEIANTRVRYGFGRISYLQSFWV